MKITNEIKIENKTNSNTPVKINKEIKEDNINYNKKKKIILNLMILLKLMKILEKKLILKNLQKKKNNLNIFINQLIYIKKIFHFLKLKIFI